MKSNYREVGFVKEVWRYPVKSIAGERVSVAKAGWQGIAGDRGYAFLRRQNRSGLPFLSAREFPALVTYGARFADPGNLDHSPVLVTSPCGREFDLYDAALLDELEQSSGEQLDIIHLWRGAFDAMPFSIITTNSVEAVGAAVGVPLEIGRFRPNIVIQAFDERAFPEDRWVGELVVIGDDNEAARIRVNRKDQRCNIVDINPANGDRDRQVMAEVVRSRKNLLGAYGAAERPGRVREGDIVWMVKE